MVPEIFLFLQAIVVSIAFGMLEAAWTGPSRGGPFNTWLGVFAILLGLAFVTFPFLWWIPILAIIEELTHIFVQGAKPTYDTIFNHWSKSYVKVNIYPYITFPMATIIGQILYLIIY